MAIMWNRKLTKAFLLGAASLMLVGQAFGGTPDEAAQLKTTLTPMGAERAGNKEGTIPAWDGGLTKALASDKNGRRSDPFPDEKPLFSITAQNMDQYADKLTDGTKAMLKKHPEGFLVDVYPTHRTAAAPQWVYDNTFLNATRGKMVTGSTGEMPSGVYGGIPFPIPHTGTEVMWNHILMWKGMGWLTKSSNYLTTSNGSRVLDSSNTAQIQMPYYFKEGSLEKFNSEYWLTRVTTTYPANHAGEAISGRLNFDDNKSQAWVYLAGQRRTRKLPNACCDTPVPGIGGLTSFDEVGGFSGRMNVYNWKILGKKEIYIPYNSNKLWVPTKVSDVMGPHNLNPDWVRWELHRVWVVEGTLAPGKSHVMHKSVYYLDEDTFMMVLGDRWDANGRLTKVVWNVPMVFPEIPAVTTSTFLAHDLLKDLYVGIDVPNEFDVQYKMQRFPDELFTGDAMAQDSVR